MGPVVHRRGVVRAASPVGVWNGLVRPLLDLLLPAECISCRRPGASWCARCLSALRGAAFAGGPAEVSPEPRPPGLPVVLAWGAYLDPLRTAIAQWKDADRRDVAPVLAGLLASAVDRAVDAAGWRGRPVVLVPVPSSRSAARRRGDLPLVDVAARAAQRLGRDGSSAPVTMPVRALAHVRRVADQAGLGTAGRFGNLRGSMHVPSRWTPVVRGRRCLVVDDVMTTGSTLAEAARALRVAGAADVRAATIAATRLRRERPGRGPRL